MNALLPLTPCDNLEIKEVNVKGDKQTNFLVSNFTVYTNMKAGFANVGKWGHSFAWRWEYLTNDDVWQFLGETMLDGLNSSPIMTSKFRS